MYHSFLIHSSVDGYLGCFHVLTIINSAAVNIGVHVSLSFESVLMRWMKLEPMIQSEVSQKEKHQYSILTHIYGIYKDHNDDPVCETAKETQMYIMGGRGRGWDDLGEWHGNMYNIICEMNHQSRLDA